MASQRELRVAFIGGPQYDILYTRLPAFEAATGYTVRIVVQLPHPELNAFIAQAYAHGQRPALDLISTHIKYAPSQAAFLLALDDYLTPDEIAALSPRAIQASRVDGRLIQAPRMVDARLLFYRTDLLAAEHFQPPATWAEVSAQARALTHAPQRYGYVFPGRYSGLFGTFFELTTMAGGRLFDETGRPLFDEEPVIWALEFLRELYACGAAPPELVGWHYDEVSTCFRNGNAAFVADWPGFFSLYTDPRASRIVQSFGVMRYPVGPSGRRAVYAGMHSFAIPNTARDVPAALALLRFLLNEESQWVEAQHGAFPTRQATVEALARTVTPGSVEAQRLEALKATIAEDMLMFPPLARYPMIEDNLWPIIQQAITGAISTSQAASDMRERAQTILR